jgi:hypothetical protein
MRKLTLFLLFASFFLGLFKADSAHTKDLIELKIGEKTKAFHMGLSGKVIKAWWPPSDEHDVFFMEDMLEASGAKKGLRAHAGGKCRQRSRPGGY